MELKMGEIIKTLRKKQGKTQENLAEALGITFQAVSRWESGLAYPDMELIPSIANYFGISIDALFGYHTERQNKVDALVERIREMDRVNNGEDVCIDVCISLAREGLIEFPGNEKLLLCLANLLYNAGYARYGEHHLTDADGYDIFDVKRHGSYAEWNEAKAIYEKLVKELADGAQKQEAVSRLTQLYALCGERERVMALVGTLPDISGAKDVLMLHGFEGKRRVEEYDRTISKLLFVCANLMCLSVVAGNGRIPNQEAVKRIQSGIAILEMSPIEPVLPNDCQSYHGKAGMYLYLSVFMWREGDYNGAFEVLERAYAAAKPYGKAKELPGDWPCWCVPDYRDVEKEMKADNRWAEWVRKCNGSF